MTVHGIIVCLLAAQVGETPAPPGPESQAQPAGPTLALEEALREARAKNLDLKAVRARLDQSRELGWQAWSAYLPQVTAEGSYTHNEVEDVTLPVATAFTVRQRTGSAG
jgi:outer membrane protein TolC